MSFSGWVYTLYRNTADGVDPSPELEILSNLLEMGVITIGQIQRALAWQSEPERLYQGPVDPKARMRWQEEHDA